jgi:hypothetical protein
MTLGPTSAWFLASRTASRKLLVLLTRIYLILAENCYLYFDSFTVCLQNLKEFKDLIKKEMASLQSAARLFIIESNQVCGVSPSRRVARRGRAIIEVKEPALSAAIGKLKVDRIADSWGQSILDGGFTIWDWGVYARGRGSSWFEIFNLWPSWN